MVATLLLALSLGACDWRSEAPLLSAADYVTPAIAGNHMMTMEGLLIPCASSKSRVVSSACWTRATGNTSSRSRRSRPSSPGRSFFLRGHGETAKMRIFHRLARERKAPRLFAPVPEHRAAVRHRGEGRRKMQVHVAIGPFGRGTGGCGRHAHREGPIKRLCHSPARQGVGDEATAHAAPFPAPLVRRAALRLLGDLHQPIGVPAVTRLARAGASIAKRSTAPPPQLPFSPRMGAE